MKHALILLFLFSSFVFAKDISSERIISSYLYNFAKYTNWPDNPQKKVFEIYLVSSDKSLFLNMQGLLKDKKVHNKEVKIVIGSFRNIPNSTSMVYMDESSENVYKTIYTYFEQKDVLLVSKNYQNKRLVMINLYETQKGTLAFEVNKENIVNQGLRIDPKMILLGGTELDVAKLYKEVKDSLLDKEKQLQSQLKKADTLSKEIRSSKEMNKELSESINKKNQKLEETSQQIAASNMQMQALEKSIIQMYQKSEEAEKAFALLLKKQKNVLENDKNLRLKHKKDLELAKAELDGKINEIQDKESKLLLLDEKVKEKENALVSAGVQIQDQTETIDTQKDFLFLLLLATALFLSLVLMILRTLRLRNEANMQLQTTQKALESQVQQTQKANASKTKFLAHMSHELRTPLNAVLGYSQILQKDQSLSQKHQKTLSTINRSGEHLLSLINDVLEVSKIETGHVELDLVAFDLYTFLDDLVNMFAPRIKEEGLNFELVKDKKLPQFIYADIGKIRQIFINILGNCVKFTSVGGIVLKISQKKNELLVQIQDSGVGIAEEEIDNLFKPFEQTLSGKLGGGGAGLGLSIVLEYINLMKGEIKVKSEPDIGTSFYLNIPFKHSNISEVSHCEYKEVLSLKEKDVGIEVLIADDNEVNLNLLEEVLTRVGYRVTTADDGLQAFNLFKKHQYKAVLLDIDMPKMNGYEVLKEIRGLESNSKVPIMAVTASIFGITHKTVIDKGFDALILKPFKDYELYESLSSLLGVKYNYNEITKEEGIEVISLDTIEADLKAMLLEEVSRMKIASVKDILSKIEVKHPREAKYMQDLADDFKYDELQKLLEGL